MALRDGAHQPREQAERPRSARGLKAQLAIGSTGGDHPNILLLYLTLCLKLNLLYLFLVPS